MEKLAAALLTELHELETQPSPHDYLWRVATLLHKTTGANQVMVYELISETGGVPQLPPICIGQLSRSEAAESALADFTHMGALSELIRTWQPHFEKNALAWAELHHHPYNTADLAHFIALEQIQSFAFLPLSQHNDKSAVLLLTYCQLHPWKTKERRMLETCAALISHRLASLSQHTGDILLKKNRMATAHTRYGEVALLFKGQIDSLKTEIRAALGDQMPPDLTTHLETTENTIFEAMRNLVIEASGDLLVNLETMPLAKALNTVAAALRRAWPPDMRITIDVPPIPLVIERQSLELRRLLYTFILEAIGNAVKHGGPAPYTHVDVTWENNQVYVQIIDHGKGFDRKTQNFSEHGLGFWEHYIVEHLAGDFLVSSQPGYGTVVNARIPVIPARVEYDVKKSGV